MPYCRVGATNKLRYSYDEVLVGDKEVRKSFRAREEPWEALANKR